RAAAGPGAATGRRNARLLTCRCRRDIADGPANHRCAMAENAIAVRAAWQPFTFGGVAAFAGGTWRRLLAVQFLFALLAAAAVVWFLQVAWFPTIRQAIEQLPAAGEIHGGRLDWGGDTTPRILAEGHFLALALDLDHSGAIRSPAHVQVELG